MELKESVVYELELFVSTIKAVLCANIHHLS